VSSFDVTILTSGHDVADARLHREVAALVAAGMSVEVLGLGRVQDGPPGATVRTWPRGGGIRRAGLAARMAATAGGRVLMSLDPDSALAAHSAVLASGRELVVDVHEDYEALLSDRPWTASLGGLAGRASRELVRASQRIAARAALTVVADDHVPPLRARRRIILPNEPDLGMLPEPSPPGPVPRALYVGDVRTSRGLFAMLVALRQATSWRLDVVGPVAPADQEGLEEFLAADPDVASRVTFHGRKPPTASWELARGAWVGLLLLHDTPAFREALPSKVGEYLACGLPVVTTDLPRQAALVRGVSGRGAAGVVVGVGDDVSDTPAGGGVAGGGVAGGGVRDARGTGAGDEATIAASIRGVSADAATDGPTGRAGIGAVDAEGGEPARGVPGRGDERVGTAVAAQLEAWARDPDSLHRMRRIAVAASVRGRAHDDPYVHFARAVADLLTGPDPDSPDVSEAGDAHEADTAHEAGTGLRARLGGLGARLSRRRPTGEA